MGISMRNAVSLAAILVVCAPSATTLSLRVGPALPIFSTLDRSDTEDDAGPGDAGGAVVETAWVYPSTVTNADGSLLTTYTEPNGSVMEMLTPPPGFDPLSANEETLSAYGFPLAPADQEDFDAWFEAMQAYRWSAPSTAPFEVPIGRPSAADAFGIDPWAGYVVGTLGTQSHTYVAVKGNFAAPTNTGTTCSTTNQVGLWIGLGGTGGTYPQDNLLQQGIECGNSHVGGAGSPYRPFYEFANTDYPKAMCGQTTWTVPAGHVIYQNMSFQTSTNKAFFYTEDQGASGQTFACSYSPPTGWHWDLNTAEWIAEAPAYYSVNFGGVTFSNDRAELYSNSTWVTLGSQTHTIGIEGDDTAGHNYECIRPGAISSGTSFLNDWEATQCKYVPL